MAASVVSAQELTASAGLLRSDEARSRTHGWLLSYTHELNARFAASLSYQNEGHVPSHHRDGYAAQLWARTSLLSPRLSLAAGVGPYRYFDTVSSSDDPLGYSDRHGWGMVYSLTATWHAGSSPWLYQLRADRVVLSHGIDTSRLTAGVGYRLQRDLQRAGESARNTEATLYLGKTIVNSLESQTATAHSAELRHTFGPLLRGSVAWLDENDAQLVKRQGLVLQAWLEPSFQRERLSLGIGYGPYIASDDQRRDRNGLFGSGLLTLTASLRLTERWLARMSWNRVISRYDRDTDVILLGVGYRF
jgi:hypothetical protein